MGNASAKEKRRWVGRLKKRKNEWTGLGRRRGRNKKFGGRERRRWWSRVFFLFFPNVTGEIRGNK
jgi:hypothetical protein